MWKVIDSGKKSASELMKIDEQLLLKMKQDDQPILHFYDFVKPSFTFGVFIKPENIMNQKVYIKDFDFSKRPTGGGVLFHVWDFAFSCLIPKNHAGYKDDVMESYKYINDRIAKGLSPFIKDSKGDFSLLPIEPEPMDDLCKNFCFAKPTKYDIMYGGKKLCGAAQRRKNQGYLHQGSISLAPPDFSMLKPLFKTESKVLSAMNLHTFPLLGSKATLQDIEKTRNEIKQSLISALSE
ncbi:MAG: Octanoyltransferase LipM [Chlamydiia bacterium]|nr:Octanoyltransferase LipM [Chlamydiia bacterium]